MMETQHKSGNAAPVEESSRDAGVYLLLWKDPDRGLSVLEIPSKKEVNSALEKLGPERLSDIRLFRGAKEVEIRTKVSFTF